MSLQGTDTHTIEPLYIGTTVVAKKRNRRLNIAVKLRSMLTVQNLVFVTVTTAFAAILFIFVYYYAHLVFNKPQQAKKGSLPYTIFINKFVKQMPAFKPLEASEKYYFNIIHNASIPVNILRYESHAPPEEIVSYYRLYFELVNYAYVRNKFDGHTMAIFHNTHEEFAVFVTTGEYFNIVSIENTKYK